MDLTLVVLAAGIGSRYGGLKQMDPVGPSGEFILDYSLFDALRAGFNRAVFIVRSEIEADFRGIIGARIEDCIEAEYVCQGLDDVPECFRVPDDRTKPWGTGHAVLTAAPAVAEPFAVVNADDFYGRQAFETIANFLRKTAHRDNRYGMVGFALRNTLSDFGSVARGICEVDPEGRLIGVTETTDIEKHEDGIRCGDMVFTGEEPVSMNMWAFKTSIFRHLEDAFQSFLVQAGDDPRAEFFMPAVVDMLVGQGQTTVDVLRTESRWFGATYPQDKDIVVARMKELVEAGEYPRSLWRKGG